MIDNFNLLLLSGGHHHCGASWSRKATGTDRCCKVYFPVSGAATLHMGSDSFTLQAERYERRSLLISSNLVFSQWDQIFKDPLTTMAAIDRLVHHSIILEFDGASQRIKKAAENSSNPTG